MSTKVAVLFLALAFAPTPTDAASPVQKVLGMLDDVGAKAKADLAAAVDDFTEASKFCDTTLVEKDYAMKKSKEILGALEATIFEADAKVKEYEFSVSELSKEISNSNGELAKLTKLREKEHANFLEVEKELVEAVETLSAASKLGAEGGASLAQMTPKMTKGLAAMKSALQSVLHAGVVTHGERSQVASLLAASEDSELTLTTKTSNDDATADLFKMLTEKTEKTLSDMRKKELDAGHEYASSKLTLENEIKSMEEETKAQQELKATTLQAQAQATKEQAVEKKVLQEDVSYSADTKRDCLSKAEDFETLHRDAVNELGALAKAKEILTKGVTASLVETKFKLRSKRDASSGDGKARALRAIQALGRKFHSTALVSLSYRAASDPFVKVRSMVEAMIAKLQQEAAEEATKEAFCKEEQAASSKSAGKKTQKLETTDARIDRASSSVAQLSEDIATASTEVAETDAALKEATAIRTKEKGHFMKVEADLSGSVDACNEAAKVLEAYYNAAALLQSASGQKGGGSIIDVLRFAESDFAAELAAARSAESVAADRYEALVKESKQLKTIKLVEIKGKESEVKSLKAALTNYAADREGIASELAAVNAYIDELKPKCDTPVESYASKKARREQEIDGLREALEMLE